MTLAWAAGLSSVQTRTFRFVALGGAATAVWAVALVAAAPFPLRIVALGALVLVVALPNVFRTHAVTKAEAAADRLLEGIASRSFPDTDVRLAYLDGIRDLVPSDAGRLTAARVRLWAAARRDDRTVTASLVPAQHFDMAATRVLRDAQWRRIVGWRTSATPWDEAIALRAINEEAVHLIPAQDFSSSRPQLVDKWTGAAANLLDDLARMPLRDVYVAAARDRMNEAITAYLNAAMGERSPAARARQAATATALEATWRDLADHIRDLRGEQ